MSQPFKCPSCGGPLEYDGGDVTVRCEFCSNLVIVPELLRERFDEKRGAVPFLEQIANLKEIGRLIRDGNYINAVFKYAPDGRFISRIGGEGEEPGLFRALNAIAVDGKGRIYVSDTKGIQVFDSNGRYLDVFKIERNVAFGMVFNDKNELFVAGRTQIVKFALNK